MHPLKSCCEAPDTPKLTPNRCGTRKQQLLRTRILCRFCHFAQFRNFRVFAKEKTHKGPPETTFPHCLQPTPPLKCGCEGPHTPEAPHNGLRREKQFLQTLQCRECHFVQTWDHFGIFVLFSPQITKESPPDTAVPYFLQTPSTPGKMAGELPRAGRTCMRLV